MLVQYGHEESPLPAALQTTPTSSIIDEVRIWGQASLREVSFDMKANFAACIKCNKHSEINVISVARLSSFLRVSLWLWST